MPGSFLGDHQIRCVIAFIRSLQPPGGTDAAAGDSAEGARIYASLDCATCHMLRGSGGRTGPDLSAVGRRRSGDYIVRSIITPQADVAPQYRVVRLTTGAGNTYSGVTLNEDTYSLQLLDLEGRLRGFLKDALRDLRRDSTSLMPSYEPTINPEQVRDLAAFLRSQRE